MWTRFHNFDRMFLKSARLHNQLAKNMRYGARVEKAVSCRKNADFAVNLHQDDKNFFLEALLPGVAKENIDMQIENNILSLKIVRKIEVPEGFKTRQSNLQSYEVNRAFRLPKDIIRDKVEAKMENGVLRLILPKAEKAQAQKIAIN